MFLLVLIKIALLLKKKNSKKGTVYPSSTNNIEIIFILLIEMILFHIYLSIIKIKKFCFELIVLWLYLIATLYLEK